MKVRHCILSMIILSGIALISGCSSRKNTAATRNYQAFITRYNIYFNGDEHYKQTLKDMESGYEDDFTTLLPMHPAEARSNPKAPQPSGSFTRSIEKAQKAIQLRSIKRKPRRTPGKSRDPEYREWLKREEYNPFIHNAWMMLAKSQYMDGDFLGAASTFMYIARHFGWLPATVAEAKIWQARSYCAAGWVTEAQAILDRVREKELSTDALKGQYAFADADIKIASGHYDEAIAPLRTAIASASGIQKTRLTFLLGQLLQRKGDNAAASEAFKKVSGSISAPYRTKFNARIRQGATASGSQADAELKAIRRMTRYERNKPYLDQIHYAEGNLLLAKGDTLGAVKAYSDAVTKSTRQGIDMAIANIALGELYFALGDYDKAQPCYSASVSLLGDDYPDLRNILLRSDVLDELAVHSRNVHVQDSLLQLADMPREEQLKVIDRIISELKKRQEEERRELERQQREEEESAASGNQNTSANAQAPTAFTLNSDNSWYFYNQSVKTAGAAEFRRRWGGRKLEDNWRRRNKSDFAAIGEEPVADESQTDTVAAADTPEENTPAANDPLAREYYLKDIPATDEQRTAAHSIIQEGLYNMGLILKDKLEDYPAAAKPWLRLLEEYPDNVYRLDTYYNMYLMYMRAGDIAQAEKYRALITADFADSPLGSAMTDPQYLENLKAMPRRQEELYQKAYSDFTDNNISGVRTAVSEAKEKYPLSPLMPKFLFLEALTFVNEGNTDEFVSSLRTIIDKYPDAEVAPLASSYLKGATGGRKIHSGSATGSSMIRSTRLIAANGDAAPEAPDSVKLNLNPDAAQMLMLTYPLDSVNANEVLYEVARFNFNTFTIRDFDLEQMEFGNLGILLIKGFADIGEVSRYMSILNGPDGLEFSPAIVPMVVSEENFAVILQNGLTLEQYQRAYDDAMTRGVHEAVLTPSEYPDENEMYGTDTDNQTLTQDE